MNAPKRTGYVSILAGYAQDRFSLGLHPVYRNCLVRELEDGQVIYYPGPDALTKTADGWCTLPAELLDRVVWKGE